MKRLLPRKLSVAAGVCAAAALLCVLPKPAHAIFGLGDLVFDPTNYEEAVSELEQDILMVNQAIQTYQLLQSELRMITQRPWQTFATALGTIAVEDLGPQAGPAAQALASAANGLADPRPAWSGAVMAIPMDTLNPVLSALASTSIPPNTAGVQLTDAFATDSLRTLGTYRQNQVQLTASIAALQTAQQSIDPADNTPIAQANITNGILLQVLKLQQSAASFNAVIAEQLTAAHSWNRNTAAEAITIQAQAINSRASSAADYAGGSSTLTDYLIN